VSKLYNRCSKKKNVFEIKTEIKEIRQPDPIITVLHSNGKFKEIYYLKNDQKNGLYESFYESGNPKIKCYYVDGILHREHIEYYDKLDCIHKYLQYDNGKLHGVIKSYHPNGKPFVEQMYENNKKNGYYKDHDKNGILRTETFFKNNELHGSYKSYTKNGALYTHYFYKNDKPNGEYKKFYKSGKLKIICNFKNGKLYGEYTSLYEDGEIKKTTIYQ
jgi:antitoxin component YwqK of YwqJK toxin-antitoxin module